MISLHALRSDNLPSRAALEWFLIGEYLCFASLVLSIAVVVFTLVDRWWIGLRGQLGSAVIEDAELIHHLPRRVWEVKLTVTPDDRTEGSFRCRSRWTERHFDPLQHSTGSILPVRFRRYPHPITFPR